jgi:hypothetical protein
MISETVDRCANPSLRTYPCAAKCVVGLTTRRCLDFSCLRWVQVGTTYMQRRWLGSIARNRYFGSLPFARMMKRNTFAPVKLATSAACALTSKANCKSSTRHWVLQVLRRSVGAARTPSTGFRLLGHSILLCRQAPQPTVSPNLAFKRTPNGRPRNSVMFILAFARPAVWRRLTLR